MVAMESKAQAQKAVKKLKVFYCTVFIFNFFMIIFLDQVSEYNRVVAEADG